MRAGVMNRIDIARRSENIESEARQPIQLNSRFAWVTVLSLCHQSADEIHGVPGSRCKGRTFNSCGSQFDRSVAKKPQQRVDRIGCGSVASCGALA